MERPKQDGYIVLELLKPVGPYQRTRLKFGFDRVERFHVDDAYIVIEVKDDEDGRTKRLYYSFAGLSTMEVVMNSDDWAHKYIEFQKQHDHFWVESEKQINLNPIEMTMRAFGAVPVDEMGPIEEPQEPKIEHCCTNKTGEEGCGATRVDGVIQYG